MQSTKNEAENQNVVFTLPQSTTGWPGPHEQRTIVCRTIPTRKRHKHSTTMQAFGFKRRCRAMLRTFSHHYTDHVTAVSVRCVYRSVSAPHPFRPHSTGPTFMFPCYKFERKVQILPFLIGGQISLSIPMAQHFLIKCVMCVMRDALVDFRWDRALFHGDSRIYAHVLVLLLAC